jgi:hypothetical protein
MVYSIMYVYVTLMILRGWILWHGNGFVYVSNLRWGVLMVLVQKRNHMSRCLKLHVSVSQSFWYLMYTFPHTWAHRGSFFLNLQVFFVVSADRR